MKPVRVRYQTIEFDEFDIHIRSLRDNQQFADPLGEASSLGISSAQWPLFGVIWTSGKVLAQEMAVFPIGQKRILELGCGIALSSLVLNSRQADITATDIHPEAGSYLAENVSLNNGRPIPFLRTGWNDLNDGLGQFDVVIGSDVLYEKEHVELLAAFIERHARPTCEVILVDPGRSNHAPFSKKMVSLGYEHTQKSLDLDDDLTSVFKGKIIRYQRGSVAN